jgi:Arc/MetJ-type ribon-helix-helix transcriptional regulator
VSPVRRVTTFRVDEELLEAMRQLQERDGILPSEQIRRALRPWLEEKGVLTKAERKRAATRKRS